MPRRAFSSPATVPAFGTVEVEFVPDRAQRGLALMHCHQQMHMESGFKTLFEVT